MAEIPQALVDMAAGEVSVHRWESMGVSSVTCECGETLHGDDSLTQFPADEAFRAHLARVVLAAVWDQFERDVLAAVDAEVRADAADVRRQTAEPLLALADDWMSENEGIAHVGPCQDFHCPTCAVAACAEDLRRLAREVGGDRG